MLNCVAVDVVDTALDRTHSTSCLAQKLVDDSRRVIEHFNKSDTAKVELVGVVWKGWTQCIVELA